MKIRTGGAICPAPKSRTMEPAAAGVAARVRSVHGWRSARAFQPKQSGYELEAGLAMGACVVTCVSFDSVARRPFSSLLGWAGVNAVMRHSWVDDETKNRGTVEYCSAVRGLR